MNKQKNIIKELEIFNDQLADYYLQRKHWDILDDSKKTATLNLHADLIRKVCKYAPLIDKVAGIDVISPAHLGRRKYNKWFPALSFEYNDSLTSVNIELCLQCMGFAIDRIRDDISKGMRDKVTGQLYLPYLVDKYKAFISHGKESAALRKLKELIETLGIEPLIVKKQPSLDKDLPDKVNLYLSQADFVIILATGNDTVIDKKTGKEITQPKQNIIHETGLAQKTHPGKIIYLLEEGAEFPSNIRPKVWESFKQRNMMNAFLGIVRELRAYGMLKLIKPQPKEQKT